MQKKINKQNIGKSQILTNDKMMAKNKTENENKDYYHIAKCFHPPISISRSSRSQMFFKIAVLKNYIIFTGKRKCCSLFSIMLKDWSATLLLSAKFLRTGFFIEHLRWLLLVKCLS